MIAELGPLTCHFSNRAPLRTCQPSREWPSLEITVLQPRGASLCRCELCVRCEVIETAEPRGDGFVVGVLILQRPWPMQEWHGMEAPLTAPRLLQKLASVR